MVRPMAPGQGPRVFWRPMALAMAAATGRRKPAAPKAPAAVPAPDPEALDPEAPAAAAAAAAAGPPAPKEEPAPPRLAWEGAPLPPPSSGRSVSKGGFIRADE